MKTVIKLALATALLALPSFGQSENQITINEFRQTLTDWTAIADARGGTHTSQYFATVPDNVLRGLYAHVPNGRAFRDAVQYLKPRLMKTGLGAKPDNLSIHVPQLQEAASSNVSSLNPRVVAGFPLFTPLYPSGSNWSSLVGQLQTDGYIPAGNAEAQRCSTDGESALSVVVSTFKAIEAIADAVCEAIPEIIVVVLGEGTQVDAKAICFAVQLIIAVPAIASEEDFEFCKSQDGFVNTAEIEAGYHNTVQIYDVLQQHDTDTKNAISAAQGALSGQLTGVGGQLTALSTQVANTGNNLTTLINNSTTQIDNNIAAATVTIDSNIANLQNLELQLQIQINLLQSGQPIGLFETPQSLGGYFELARTIVQNAIASMTVVKGPTPAIIDANSQFKLGERQLALGQYTAAYAYYQAAYASAAAPQ
jgi:hypothetical protein